MSSGYINRKIPQSVEEAVSQYSTEAIKTIAKAGVQKYIQSFLDKSGGNRKLFELITREGLKYITDDSHDFSQDPDLRKLQIARMFEGVRHELPAILITDTSFNIVPTNWTGIDAVSADQDYVYSRIAIARTIGMAVLVGTRDRSSADMLHSILSILFSELRFKAGGNRLTGNTKEGSHWVMVLPQPVLGPVSQSAVQNDPKDQMYMFTIELPEILFEDHFILKEKRPEIPFLNEGIANPPDGSLENVIPEIILPDEIKINQRTPVYFKLFQERFHSFRVSNPNICTFDPRDQILNPRRLGEFEVQIVRKKKYLQGDTELDTIVTSKLVRVVP